MLDSESQKDGAGKEPDPFSDCTRPECYHLFAGLQNELRAQNYHLANEIRLLRAESGKRRRRWMLWVSIALFFYAAMFFIGSIAFFAFETNPASTEKETVEFTATIAKIQPLPYAIRVEEFDAALTILESRIVVDMDALGGLTAGQTITFGIKEADRTRLDRITESISIVSLKTNEAEIITQDSYNDYYDFDYSYDDKATAVTFLVLGLIFAAVGTAVFVIYRRKTKQFKVK